MTIQKKYFKTIAVLLCLSCMVCFQGCRKRAGGAEGSHAHSQWMTDFEKAKQVAKDSGKDLLVDFAGSDWCYWCKKLDAEVFKIDEFIYAAGKNFVFVLIDFPSDKSGQSAAQQQKNDQLAQKYGIEGFPTVILMDASGNAYAKTGYIEGGPKAYLKHLNDLKSKTPSADAD